MKTLRLMRGVRRAGYTCLLTATAVASGCVSLLPDPEPADLIYRLTTKAESKSPLSNAPVVRLDRPAVANALRGNDIVLYGQATQVTRAGGAVWSDDVPTLIQRSLFDILAANETLTGVLPNSGARPTYRVSLNVRRFEADFDRSKDFPPQVISHYSAVLSDGASRELISTFDIKREKRAASISVSSIVEAQSEVNQEALEAVSDWISSSLLTYTPDADDKGT